MRALSIVNKDSLGKANYKINKLKVQAIIVSEENIT